MPKPKGQSTNGNSTPKLQVRGDDLANLRASGLTDSTIIQNGLRTEHDAASLARILNRGADASCCLGGLVFRYRDLRGNVNGFARVRPHFPRNKYGKQIKYEQPKDTHLRAYFPVASLPLLREGESRIFITEGEKKALALSQLGLAAIGLGGVDCWGKYGKLISDLAEIGWNGRDVAIVFDYDEKAETRRNVDGAKRRLAKALKAAGAHEVYNVELPPGPDGKKQGIDDFLVVKGETAFTALAEEAQPVQSERAENRVIKIIPMAVPELGEAAYHGPVGEFLRAVAPHTEATDAGILAHLLPAAGMLVGPKVHVFAGSKQYARIFTGLVGRTNAGRKGTSLAPVNVLMDLVDGKFWNRQRVSGLSSGEGLIAFVADKETKDKDGKTVIDPVERRLYVVEEEFSRVLANIRREGNILSQIIRSAFDDGNLSTLTVNPRHAVGAHISIVGHITPEELTARLDHIEMANGFGNRILWFAVESDKVLPRTAPIPSEVFSRLEKQLRTLKTFGDAPTEFAIEMATDAQALWEEVYPRLRQDQPGLAGTMVARGASMVLRLALIYCLLDVTFGMSHLQLDPKRDAIRVVHLEAALAVWDYCEASAQLLFGSETGDKLCDKLLHLLGNSTMTKAEINKHLSPKQKAEVGRALEKMEAGNLIRKSTVKHEGAGRPAEQWEKV